MQPGAGADAICSMACTCMPAARMPTPYSSISPSPLSSRTTRASDTLMTLMAESAPDTACHSRVASIRFVASHEGRQQTASTCCRQISLFCTNTTGASLAQQAYGPPCARTSTSLTKHSHYTSGLAGSTLTVNSHRPPTTHPHCTAVPICSPTHQAGVPMGVLRDALMAYPCACAQLLSTDSGHAAGMVKMSVACTCVVVMATHGRQRSCEDLCTDAAMPYNTRAH